MKIKKKKSKHSIPTTKDSLGVISYQLREIREDLAKNNKDIEDLKEQVNLGKGGIKAYKSADLAANKIYTKTKYH